jgi:hypothetical protein
MARFLFTVLTDFLDPADSDRAVHKIVCVQADSLTPLETPDDYRNVLRRIFGHDGQIRPWSYG